MKIDLYNQQGEKTGQVALPKEIFEIESSEPLIHEALIRQLSNKRQSSAHVKTKAEVRGGGRKPYAQKGTGRARQGSIRAPHYRGGGKAFGPRNIQNYFKRMPKKMRRKALFGILSDKARENAILALDKYEATKPKTKDFKILIDKLPIKRNVLIIIPAKNEIIEKSARNLKNTKTILVNYLNPADILKYKNLLFLEEAIKNLPKIFLK